MKTTFLRLPFYGLLGAGKYGLNTYPLNICYLSSSLKRFGYKTELVDGETMDFDLPRGIENLPLVNKMIYYFAPELIMNLNHKRLKPIMNNPDHHVWEKIMQEIKKTGADAVAITCYTSSMNGVKTIARHIKEELDVPVILGGIHPTSFPYQTIKYVPDADYIVMGEGENTVVDLARHIERDRGSPNSIKGVGYKKGNEIKINSARKLITNLDEIPFPDREFIKKEEYRGDVMITSRGCPYSCIFCASRVLWGCGARFRSVDNVIKELVLLKERYKSSFVRFVDDTFTLNKKRVMEMCSKMKKEGLDEIDYSVGSRVDTMDEEMAKNLKEAGVKYMTFGVESGSQRILDLLKKNFKVHDVPKAIGLTNKYGIHSHMFIMIGNPTETKKDIALSREIVKKSNPTSVEANIVSPYPKTEMWDMMIDKKPEDVDDWFEWFHQGMSKSGTGNLSKSEVNREYRKFIWFAKYHQLKRKLLSLGGGL